MRELYYREHNNLRDELHNLKKCQVQFFTFAITTTGILLGLGEKLGTDSSSILASTVYLFPLVILLPSWWVFFDKATTITRIVGYYRVLEEFILNKYPADKFIGWERSLKKFREMQMAGDLVPDPPDKRKTTHGYWIIIYFTFLTLSFLCVFISIIARIWIVKPGRNVHLAENICGWAIIGITLAIVLWTTYKNGVTVWRLIYQDKSYNQNEKFWRKILELSDKQEGKQSESNGRQSTIHNPKMCR